MPNISPQFKLNYDYLEGLHVGRNYTIYKPTILKYRKFEHIEIDVDKKVFRLKDKSQHDVVSVIVLEKKTYHGNEFYEVKWSNSKKIGFGYMLYLFDLIVNEFNYKLISDESHTLPGSMDFWLSLDRKKKFDLYIFNIKTGYKRKYKNYPIEKIWGMELYGDDEMKLYIIEDMHSRRLITTNMYEFVTKNIKHIEDRSDIRLICQQI